jgi:hypothetical protein
MLIIKQLLRIITDIIILVIICAILNQDWYIIRVHILLYPYEKFHPLITKTAEHVTFL